MNGVNISSLFERTFSSALAFVFRLGEACNHIAALLFALEDYEKNHNDTTSEDIAFTSKPCEWNKSRKRKPSPKRIDELRQVKHQYGKEPRLAAVPSDGKYKACATLPNSALSNLLDGLRIVNPRCALFTSLKTEQTVFSVITILQLLKKCQVAIVLSQLHLLLP